MIKVTDRFIAPSRGTVEQVDEHFEHHPPCRLEDSKRVIRRVSALSKAADMDQSLPISRIADETGATSGDIARFLISPIYCDRLNIGGLGVTDGGDLGISFDTPEEAADAYMAHLFTYVLGDDYNILGVTPSTDVRFDATPVAWRGSVKTLDDLKGKWFTNPQGAINSAARGNSIFPGIPDQQSGGSPVPTRPIVVIDAGHRSTDRSGNPAEMALTDDMAAEYTAEFRRQGFTANWWQRDLDADSDPDETIGDLNTVALGIGRYIATQVAGGKDVLFISCHYNGAHSPLHAIVADNLGLSTAYPGGAPADDTAANNKLDVNVGAAIMTKFAQGGLGSLFNGRVGRPGIMSEMETGVGLDGFRLAVFAATVNGRERSVRLVVEHGGTADPAALRPDFTTVCARLAVEGVIAAYNLTGPTPEPIPEPEPEPTPTPAKLKLPKGMSPQLAERIYGQFKDEAGKVYEYDRSKAADKQAKYVQAWLKRGNATVPKGKDYKAGRFPAIFTVIRRGNGKHVYVYTDGSSDEL